MILKHFLKHSDIVVLSLEAIKIPRWDIVAFQELLPPIQGQLNSIRFVLVAAQLSASFEYGVTLATSIRHDLCVHEHKRHDYKVTVCLDVIDNRGSARPISVHEVAYECTNDRLIVGDKKDDFQNFDDLEEVIIDSIQKVQVRL